MSERKAISSARFSLRALPSVTACVAVVTILICAFKGVYEKTKTTAIDAEIRNDFKLIDLGLRNFESSYGRLPPVTDTDVKGQPFASWRARIMPYLQDWNMSFYPNESWMSANNAEVRALRPWVYCWKPSAESRETDVFAIRGDDTLFPDLPESRPGLSLVPAQLIVLMEVADSNTHWMQPGDYNVTDLLAATGNLGDTVHGVMKDRIHILFADGEVWALSPKTPMVAVKPFFTITAAKTANRDSLAPYRID